MARFLRRMILSACSLLAVLNLPAQTFQFKKYGQQDGIYFPFIYSIDQDSRGYLLVGTGEGLYRFDGFNFRQFLKKDSLAQDFVLCSFRDSKGVIWFGHNEGAITSYENGRLKPFDLGIFSSSRINAITEDAGGAIWVATQNDGLIKMVNRNKPKSYYKDLKGTLVYSMTGVPGGGLLVGTDVGLIYLKESSDTDDTFEMTYLDGSPLSVLSLSPFYADHCYAGTEDEGLYRVSLLNGLFTVEPIGEELQLDAFRIVSVFEDSDESLWLSTLGGSLQQIIPQSDGTWKNVDYGADGQISSNVKLTFKDREGNLWIGTYGDGLAKKVNNQFSCFKFIYNKNGGNSEVHSFFSSGNGIWMGTQNGLLYAEGRPNNVRMFYNEIHGVPQDSVIGIYADSPGNHWIATARNGIFKMNVGDTIFKPVTLNTDKLSYLVTSLAGNRDKVYAGTKNGLFEIDVNSGEVRSISNRDGLLHNKIRALYTASDGKLWIGTEGNGINYLDQAGIHSQQLGDPSWPVIVRCITEDSKGAIWVGTEGDGVLRAGPEPRQFSNEQGLYSNYTRTIIADNSNRLWVGHTGGLSRIDLTSSTVEVIGENAGLQIRFSDNAAFRDELGNLWFPSSAGLMKYSPALDIDNTIEPALSIASIQIGDREYLPGGEIRLPYGVYKVRFDFIGISHKDADNVGYKFLLEGHDLDWSPVTQSRYAIYNRLESGEYTFYVTSYNADGVGGTSTETIRIIIDNPFWKKPWFIGLCLLIAFLTIRYIIIRRERFLKANQEYLQSSLDERTREVVHQKELLEQKNKDITSSIEYAKNIQRALIPSPEKLGSFFRDSFVYFKPRDIVSGDFYWVEEFGDKVILACADCTGHGVPGAFMSLIGSTLLTQVCNKADVDSPGQVLRLIDKELRKMVNQQLASSGIEDGMDISVVEFCRTSLQLRIASARRPVIVYHRGERIEIRGDRFSIGGSVEEDKEFQLLSLQLRHGDSFYMFSDGLPDQFGGSQGKKLKKKGVLDILDRLNGIEMTIQFEVVKEKFKNWQGDFAQVDDIILIGVRV